MLWSLVLLLVSTIAKGDETFVDNVLETINQVKPNIFEDTFHELLDDCTEVRHMLGVDYNDLQDERKSNLDKLTFIYISPELNVSVNINRATELLTSLPRFLKQKLVIYIHGFNDEPTSGSYRVINDAFARKGAYTLLGLDSYPLIGSQYFRATTFVRYIGEKLGSILVDFVNKGLPLSSIHLVGHSLGAQIAAFAGKRFTSLTGDRLPRVTGLDPAGPCYYNVKPDLRLQPTDADFVDVIHSNGNITGYMEPSGQLDFYPNGGVKQPGCQLTHCNHNRSWQYFAESVNNEYAFPALQCDCWEQFKKGHSQCKNITR